MLSFWRRDDAADPAVFLTGVVAVLSRYPREVIERVTDPATGLPSRLKWLPSIAEIREACDAEMAPIWAAMAREADLRKAKQLASEEAEFRRQKQRAPSLEALKARYGPNWGLSDVRDEKTPHYDPERLRRANEAVMRRECERRGVPMPGPLEPSPLLLENLAAARREDGIAPGNGS